MFHLLPPSPARNLKFPLWKYLSQPILNKQQPLILSPRHFWCFYQVQFLEHCFDLECPSSHLN
ncbi:hypothetical protein PROH_10650 [Prochlorothrix hollandica PCC 9006 = CALU 1027]|uniref:Uncharacterized protein n=1 Tax=Prochlorothrix hollandica PCC 9006 = CALU 1027 TaxID=317619 RepID=A0A0M2PZN8_PROHO|nr:hypothetical protein PROH_10650 [Prochlorothrix hollandica PCC 9006 = CALU 1027]